MGFTTALSWKHAFALSGDNGHQIHGFDLFSDFDLPFQARCDWLSLLLRFAYGCILVRRVPGGKMPLRHSPAEGDEGLRKNLELLAAARSSAGEDFWLMLDCWMSLNLEYATRLAHAAQASGLKWLEECLPPDDYWGYAELRRRIPPGMLLTTGEHEATRWGFRLLLEMRCCDIIQPDVGWCGGITELLKISALADAHNALVIPHGSSVYSYHFVVTRHNSPFAEFLMMGPDADKVVPMFHPLLLDEPVPVNGRMKVPDRPGFGVRLNPECKLDRPYKHG